MTFKQRSGEIPIEMHQEYESAPVSDVMSALELRFGAAETIRNEESEELKLTPQNVIKFINMAGISPEDTVLDAFAGAEMVTCAISYLAQPKKLVSTDLSYSGSRVTPFEYDANANWKHYVELLEGYSHTQPRFVTSDITQSVFLGENFSAVIGDFAGSGLNTKESFAQTGDTAAKTFKNFLVTSENVLEQDGRLVTLCRPNWVLKHWQLINDMKLQLEYPQFSLELLNELGPNTPVGLKFVKRGADFDDVSQERALLSLMRNASIDHMYAHKANAVYPYNEMITGGVPIDTIADVSENKAAEQFFFTKETSDQLAKLAGDNTAFLGTPSVALRAKTNGAHGVLFEQDPRFVKHPELQKAVGVKAVKYNMQTGLNKLTTPRYAGKFDTLICDPPFSAVRPNQLATDIGELVMREGSAYVVYPSRRMPTLVASMQTVGFKRDLKFEQTAYYANPPMLVREQGEDAIKIYRFIKEC